MSWLLQICESTSPSIRPQISLPPTEMYIADATVAIMLAIAIIGAVILIPVK